MPFFTEKHAVKIRDCSTRLEERLRRTSSQVNKNFVGKRGRYYITFGNRVANIAIRNGELLKITEVEKELLELAKANSLIEEENNYLRIQCEELYNNLLRAEMQNKEAEEMFVDMKLLEKENLYLTKYLDKIEAQEKLKNNGEKVADLKERQQRRKVRELKTKVDQALWFAKTYGLHLGAVKLVDEAGEYHTLDYSQSTETLKRKAYECLSDEDKDKVKQILYITDKFCIGEAAYREFTMQPGGEQLPRSYLIKQCKNDLNQLCHISRTPGKAEGAQLRLQRRTCK